MRRIAHRFAGKHPEYATGGLQQAGMSAGPTLDEHQILGAEGDTFGRNEATGEFGDLYFVQGRNVEDVMGEKLVKLGNIVGVVAGANQADLVEQTVGGGDVGQPLSMPIL